MPTYNPTLSKYLTVSQARTNNGQKDIRIILDVESNLFYTLDDDGNFNLIGNGGDTGSTTTKHYATIVNRNDDASSTQFINNGDIYTGLTQGIEGIEYNDNDTIKIKREGNYEINITFGQNAGDVALTLNGNTIENSYIQGGSNSFSNIYSLQIDDEIQLYEIGGGGFYVDNWVASSSPLIYQPYYTITIKEL